MVTVIRESHLFYKDFRSDKEYHLILTSESGKYRVTCKFGPRGGTLTHVDKTKGLVTYTKACDVYAQTLHEKTNKGYKLLTDNTKLIERIKRETGIQAWFISDTQWDALAEFVKAYAEEVA